jgi:hypothetical protein
MYSPLSENERRELARRYMDASEAWLRKIIDYQLSQNFGVGYFSHMVSATTPVIPKAIREDVTKRIAHEPGRFARPIDATTFGQAVTIILHPTLHEPFFKLTLAAAYPDGVGEARTFLGRIESLRNKLAHGATCSVRELEQAVCYSNDLVESLKEFFVSQNKQRLSETLYPEIGGGGRLLV